MVLENIQSSLNQFMIYKLNLCYIDLKNVGE